MVLDSKESTLEEESLDEDDEERRGREGHQSKAELKASPTTLRKKKLKTFFKEQLPKLKLLIMQVKY